MKRTILTGITAALLGSATYAQDISQTSDEWFTAGQARIQAELAKQPNTSRAKNIILMIADGNGVPTNYATRIFQGQQNGGFGDENILPYEAFPNLALVKTYNTNAQTPDSAGTASAMMAGVKTKAGVSGVNDKISRGECATITGNEVTLFTELTAAMGKSNGAISTARVTHATPAAAYAKTVDRNFEATVPEGCTQQKDIASQLIDMMANGTIDVAMGGGRRNFIDGSVEGEEGKAGRREDGRNLIDEAKELGAYYAWNDETFASAPMDGTPVLGLFESGHMKYQADRSGEPSLAEMTAGAINMLKNNEEGFFLQIEAGRVDHANHAGNLARVVRDGVAFAEAVALADEMTDDTDTLLIVTADHGHALTFNGYCGRGTNITGLCMGIDNTGTEHTGEPVTAKDGKPYTVAGYLNGGGTILREDVNWVGARPDLTEEEATDIDYLQQSLVPTSSETHSGVDVAVYAKGPWAHLFDGTIEQSVIFHVMHHAANAE